MSEENIMRFKTVIAENYIKFTANKVWGGVVPSGDLFELNFLFESFKLPTEGQIELDENGAVIAKNSDSTGKVCKEKYRATAYISLQCLFSTRDWLNRKVKELEETGLIQKDQKNE